MKKRPEHRIFHQGFIILLETSLTSLGDLARIGGRRDKTKMGFMVSFSLLDFCSLLTCRLNLDLTLLLKVVLLLSTKKLSQ